MKHYVLGFMFDDTVEQLVLIEKQKPAFQKGKYNGVGGKIEKIDNNPEAAMRREFWEETGVDHADWKKVCVLEGKDDNDPWVMHVYTTISEDAANVQTKTAEKVSLIKADELPDNIMPNLMWLIPMSLHILGMHFSKKEVMTYHVKQM